MHTISDYINVIKLLVLIACIYALTVLNWKKSVHKKVLLILLLSFFVEFTNSILIFFDKKYGLPLNVYIFFNTLLWLFIEFELFKITNKIKKIVTGIFVIYAISNLLFFERVNHFNYQTFVFGALLYLVLFIYYSFNNLKKEDLNFFQSNNYLLLFSPVIYFIGLSFVFSFESKMLTSYIIFFGIKFYTFISNVVNIIYYLLILIYIYNVKKTQNAS